VNHPRRSGFSWPELLTVVAIVATLAGGLLPVLGESRARARLNTCTEHQYLVARALLAYADDYDRTLPPYSPGDGFHGANGWLGGDGPRWGDAIVPYLPSSEAFNCPDHLGALSVYPGGRWLNVFGYSYGYSTPLTDHGPGAGYGVAGRRLSELATPAATIMLADTGTTGDPSARITVGAYDTLDTLPSRVDGFRHARRGPLNAAALALVAAYADGHVKWTPLAETFPAGWMAVPE
jgi:type II secretory pathway pseudopilin PulG